MRKKSLSSLLCLLLAALLCLSACGGSSASSIDMNDVVISGAESTESAAETSSPAKTVYATDGDVSFPAALYLLFMQDAFRTVQDKCELDYAAVPAADFSLSDGTVTTGADYIRSYADEEFKWLYVIERLCREQGLAAEDSNFYTQSALYAGETYKMAPDYYDSLGITVQDLLRYYLYSYLYNDLFYQRYGKSGEKEIAVSELEDLMLSRSYRLQYAYLPFYDAETQAALSAEETANRRVLAQQYLERYNAGADFEDLVYESYCVLDPATTRTAETSYDFYIAKEGGSFPQELVEAVASLADGEAKLVETQSYAAVVLRRPVNEKQNDAWRSAALQLAHDIYGAEFDTDMLAVYTAVTPSYNEDTRALLTPSYYVSLLDGYYAK